jgi:hypothetical protein
LIALIQLPTSIQYRCSAFSGFLTRQTPTEKRCVCSYCSNGPFAHCSNSGGGWFGSKVEYQKTDSIPISCGGPIPVVCPGPLSFLAARRPASGRKYRSLIHRSFGIPFSLRTRSISFATASPAAVSFSDMDCCPNALCDAMTTPASTSFLTRTIRSNDCVPAHGLNAVISPRHTSLAAEESATHPPARTQTLAHPHPAQNKPL